MNTSRIASTQPSYDFLTGGPESPPQQSLRQTFRQSAVKPGMTMKIVYDECRLTMAIDLGNEELRVQINSLKYELESLKQERELSALQHEKELHEVQARAEEDYKKAQVGNPTSTRYLRCTLSNSVLSRRRKATGARSLKNATL